jgi:hypothetical protein
MAKLYVQNRGEKPKLAADADRATVGRISVQLAAQAKAAGMHVKGCAAAWSVCSPAGAQVAVWVEFSATQIAEAPIPAWCRAPEGAPQ